MITTCHSYGESCPCVRCEKECCTNMYETDTEKLCEVAREHCEKCALEYEELNLKR